MSEDEATNQANTLLKAMRNASERNLNSILFEAVITRSDIKAIETILDLYSKEKDSNQWLLKAFDESRNNNIELAKEYCKIQQELKQEKEKNKELEEKQNRLAFKTNQYMNDVLSNNIVSKDKIRAKMEEIMNYTYISREERQQQNYAYDRLKELLEEN